MSTKIKIKRNTLANIGTLDVGEPYLATDTFDLYLGTSAGNKQIAGVVVLDTRYLKLSGGTMTGSLIVKSVTDAGPMTTTNGTVGEIVFNISDSGFYGCTVTGTPATWVKLG